MINIGGFTGLSNSIKIGGGISSFNPFRMIDNGILINATFERSGDVVVLINAIPVVFGPNEPVVVDGRLIHHGAITETTPTYDISPIVRPTAPDVYDTAASAPNPDKHGANWEFSEARNKWVWDLLDGVADGVELSGDLTTWTGTPGLTELTETTARINTPSTFAAISKVIQTVGNRYTLKVKDTVDSGAVGFVRVDNTTEGSKPLNGDEVRYTAAFTTAQISRAASPTDRKFTVELIQISPATGTLTLKNLSIVPGKTQWQTVGDFNILSGDDDLAVSQILYVEQTTGLICATDGVNTCKSASEYIAGTDHQVDLIFNGTQMAIVLDGVQGTASAFTGHFPVGVTIKQGFENEDVWSPADIYGQPGTPVIL